MNKSVFYYLVVLVLIAFLVVMFRTNQLMGMFLNPQAPNQILTNMLKRKVIIGDQHSALMSTLMMMDRPKAAPVPKQ